MSLFTYEYEPSVPKSRCLLLARGFPTKRVVPSFRTQEIFAPASFMLASCSFLIKQVVPAFSTQGIFAPASFLLASRSFIIESVMPPFCSQGPSLLALSCSPVAAASSRRLCLSSWISVPASFEVKVFPSLLPFQRGVSRVEKQPRLKVRHGRELVRKSQNAGS